MFRKAQKGDKLRPFASAWGLILGPPIKISRINRSLFKMQLLGLSFKRTYAKRLWATGKMDVGTRHAHLV